MSELSELDEILMDIFELEDTSTRIGMLMALDIWVSFVVVH